MSLRIQKNPGNSNSDDKWKIVRVNGLSSYPGGLII